MPVNAGSDVLINEGRIYSISAHSCVAPVEVADQPLGGDPGHDIVTMVDPPPAVVSEGVGEGIGDFGRIGAAECRPELTNGPKL